MTATPLNAYSPAGGVGLDTAMRPPEWADALGRWADGPYAVIAADLIGQRLVSVTGNLPMLLGIEAEQLRREGLPLYSSLSHPDDEPTLAQFWAELLELARSLRPDQRAGLTWTLNRRFRHADGSYRWLMVQMKPLAWDPTNGHLAANLGILTDITPLHPGGPPVGWARYPDAGGRWQCVHLPRKGQSEVSLTLREREVLRAVAQGLTSAEIAQRLFISKETVDTHRKRILAKAHVKNTAELVRLASRLGLV